MIGWMVACGSWSLSTVAGNCRCVSVCLYAVSCGACDRCCVAQHIFFWAHSVFGLWEARVGNESWGYPMPPLDEIWILKPRKIVLNEWNAASLALFTQGFDSRVYDLGDK